ncbi:MAG: hypothetical protein F6K39_10600 [Okeania sp. SIO3B3]|nr:hypothetical protein [Okeania sp. SIO3B3]
MYQINFIRIYLISKNYNVAVFWYLWNKAIAILSKCSFVGLSQSATQQNLCSLSWVYPADKLR